jgi:antirestriction protein ArdC
MPSQDRIQMPPFEFFRDPESYYATLLHETVHWTKHPKRLDREFGRKRWGDEGYAMEELVAEIGAAFLSADLGITPDIREDHASYIASWLKVLKNDKRAIFTASGHAQRAASFLHDLQPSQPEHDAVIDDQPEQRLAMSGAPRP